MHLSRKLLHQITKGNHHFLKSKEESFFKEHIKSQKPEITLVACSDSRVQTEIFTEEAINKVFVIRNIGNQIENNLGSVDFGVLYLKTPILFILGHINCGAIKTFLSGYKEENKEIRYELDHLHNPLNEIKSKNKDTELQKAVEENIHWQIDIGVRRYKELIDKGKLTIIGGVYDFGNFYKKGYGRIIMLNINGERKPEKIKETLKSTELPEEIINKMVL